MKLKIYKGFLELFLTIPVYTTTLFIFAHSNLSLTLIFFILYCVWAIMKIDSIFMELKEWI